MTEQMERLLRESLAAEADDAPIGRDLAAGARRRVRQQRQRKATVAGAALGVLAVVGVVVFAVTPESRTPNERTPPASEAPTASAGPALWYRGVMVPVPAKMLDPEARRCGTTVADAAYVVDSGYGVELCGASAKHPERLTEVVLQPWDLPALYYAPAPGERVLRDGRTQLVTRVPRSDLRFIVTSPDAALARRLFDGLRIVERPDGCEVRPTQPWPDKDSSGTATLAPADASRGTVCGYYKGWLTTSHRLTAGEAASVRKALESAPGARARGDMEICTPSAEKVEVRVQPRWVVQLEDDGATTTIWVPPSPCTPPGPDMVNERGAAVPVSNGVISVLMRLVRVPSLIVLPEQNSKSTEGEMVELPTSDWRPGDVGQQALMEGTLFRTDDGCFYVSSDGGYTRQPVVWPHGYSARKGSDGRWEVLDASGRLAVREGEKLSAGGGLNPAGDRPCMLGKTDAFFIQSQVERIH